MTRDLGADVSAGVRRRGSEGVLAAVDRFCRYYQTIHHYIDAGVIRSSVDRGAFVRPQDAMPPEVMALLWDKRDSHSYAYGPEVGDEELRELVAAVENARHGTRYGRENVVIVPGAWSGVSLSFEEIFGLSAGRAATGSLAASGPTHYQLFHRAINALGVRMEVVEFTATARHTPVSEADVDMLLALDPRAVFITNPTNPDGLFVPAHLLHRLVERAAVANAYVVIDEIQDFLRRPGAPGLNYGPWIAAPNVIRIDSLSKKCGLADYRVGWVIADPEVLGTRTSGLIGRLNGIMGNAPRAANTAMIGLLRAELARLGGGPDILAPIHESLLAREAYVHRRIREIPGIEILPSEACINTTIRLPGKGDDLKVAEALMRRGTLIMPCSGYGYLSGDLVFRITFAERLERLEHALDCLIAYCHIEDTFSEFLPRGDG